VCIRACLHVYIHVSVDVNLHLCISVVVYTYFNIPCTLLYTSVYREYKYHTVFCGALCLVHVYALRVIIMNL